MQAQEAVFDVALVVAGHEGARALAAHHQVLGGQFVDGLAHGALAHVVALGQFHFAGDGFERLPFAGFQTVQDGLLDLLVERAEGGRGLRQWCGNRSAGLRHDGVGGLWGEVWHGGYGRVVREGFARSCGNEHE